MSIKTFIDVLRLRQWVKNLFIISPLIFSGRFNEIHLWLHCLLTMAAFCLVSSGMYIINDLVDLNEDRRHPKKAQRPLAAGRVKTSTAKMVAMFLLGSGGLLCLSQGRDVFILALCYVLLHVLYNLRTKHLVILDVLTVALGFQIRIWAGSAAVHIIPSAWLQICMFVLALFLGFTKRRCEIVYLENSASSHRAVLSHYTEYFLDQMIVICSTLSIVLYGLYTVSAEVTDRIHGYAMFYSIGFVVYGIFRYLYLLHVKKLGDDPSEALLSDRPMMINIVLWLLFIVTVIQLAHT
ncbi:MAG: decaprenyl-phosphate phosphoribosyltransferase [Candidatus Omnitrophica bacterium]|nr:decaprenyl-phosphate phosphoribosyltransferase [Candidatus Omnitrophota bacterium]